MKKVTLLVTVVVLSVLVWSCGGNTEKKQNSDQISRTKDNSAFSTKEGMTKKLETFNFKLPEGLVYKQIEPAISNRYLENTGYSIIYTIENNDESQEILKDWFTNQFNQLISDGWIKNDYREDVEMMGSGDLYSTFSVMKQKESGNYYLLGCNLNKNRISISAGESNYELTGDQL
jgi:hypothetical protein